MPTRREVLVSAALMATGKSSDAQEQTINEEIDSLVSRIKAEVKDVSHVQVVVGGNYDDIALLIVASRV